MEKFFKLKEHGTNARTEIVAGFTTFFTMAYIIMVNPDILGLTGMDKGGVFVATVLSAVTGTLFMALVANVPYALAPGMGLNAFFTFTVCFSMGFVWQEAMAMVFVCGLLNILITATKIRKTIIRSIPDSMQNAIGGAIGLFIAYIGVKNAGFLTFVSDPGRNIVLDDGTVIADSSIIPELSKFADAGSIVGLIGLIIMVVLLILKIRGAIFIGIIATTIISIPMGITHLDGVQWFSLDTVGKIKETSFSFFGDPGIVSMFNSASRVFMVLIAVFAFSLSDMFDTIGTFIGTGRISGIFDSNDERALEGSTGFKSKMDKALFADASATSVGALLGTSNVTTYVESAAGIAVGGRTGLTSLVVSALFLLCLPFAGAFGIVPGQATAPALIVVGIMMMSSFVHVKWDDFDEATPAFMTVIFMVFSYNISYGIAAGFIFYCIVKICKNKSNEINPLIAGATILFILNFVVQALRDSGII